MNMLAKQSGIVTGASGGIGAAAARMLVEEGYDVTLSGRNLGKLELLAEELRVAVSVAAAPEVRIAPGDVTDPDYLFRLVEGHVEAFGGIDVLVNNAGVLRANPIEHETDEDIDALLQANLRAVIMLTRNSLPHLLLAAERSGRAHVINTASNAGLRGEGTIASYSASKAGVVAYTEAVHQEYSLRGIRATAICPGLTDSSMTEMYRDVVPQGDMIDPRDIAEGIRFVIRCVSNCIVPQLVFLRGTEWLDSAPEHAD